jgi:hypothetical protein
MERNKAGDFDQDLIDLYDHYAHGLIERREFLDRAAKFAVGGLTAAALLDFLSPNYALAKQVDDQDPRIIGEFITYDSPKGRKKISAYLVHPAAKGRRGGGGVVHKTGPQPLYRRRRPAGYHCRVHGAGARRPVVPGRLSRHRRCRQGDAEEAGQGQADGRFHRRVSDS